MSPLATTTASAQSKPRLEIAIESADASESTMEVGGHLPSAGRPGATWLCCSGDPHPSRKDSGSDRSTEGRQACTWPPPQCNNRQRDRTLPALMSARVQAQGLRFDV